MWPGLGWGVSLDSGERSREQKEFRLKVLLARLHEMAFLLMSVTLLHLVTLTMLFIATMEKSWWVWDEVHNSDLWYNCMFLQCHWILVVCRCKRQRVAAALAGHDGGLFYFTGLCQICAGLTDFAASLLYTVRHRSILQDSREEWSGTFGYCFILAWMCAPLLLVSGVMYVHLRKKE
ncbi:hypothetical protein AGOR_G00154180 [Albula goreensis]|uniref:Epithelial membrane protein 3 n=1 Tax=Albula goreensis TaxID=1534307 RepID=A0A8T3D466_9TELE|nr:hypothetical protein AGOR_G00154180 [Albula goreensis]